MIVEAHTTLDLLQPTWTATDPASITVERFDTADAVPLRSVFWVHGSDADSVGDALDGDETVSESRRLSTNSSAALFRAYHPADLPVTEVYHSAVTNDVLVLDATTEGDDWSLTLWLSDRDSLSAFREACADAAAPLRIHSMYNDEPQQVGNVYGLTEHQREILQLAVQNGYFTIPREVTLSELSDQLDLSSQAASERLRRGIRTLVQTLLDEQRASEEDLDTDSR